MAKKLTLNYLTSTVTVVVGIVLVWRGIWYVLDELGLMVKNGW